MRRTRALWEVFVRRFEDAFRQYRRSRLTAEEAGELLGMSGRQFRRLCVRFADEGVEGLRDRRIGKASPRRAPARELERIRQLYRDRYSDFTVKHFHEQLVRRHSYKLGYTVTRLSLQAAGLVAKAKRRGAHRKRRPRRPLPGMLLFQDGSTYRWIASLERELDLVVTPRRRHRSDLFGHSGRTGRHIVEFSRAHGDDHQTRAVQRVLYRSGQPLLRHQGQRRDGRQDAPDPGRPGAAPTRDHAYCVLLTAGARTHRAGVRYLAEPAAAGVAAGADHDAASGQPIPEA